MNDMFSLEGKTALITGSSRGIGAALSRGLAVAGAVVIVNGRDIAVVTEQVNILRKEGLKAEGYAFDITDAVQVEDNVRMIEKNTGQIDILINNAGIQRRNPLERMSERDWKSVIDVNLTAAFTVSRCVVARMMERKKGKIINITSLMAERVRPTTGNYCAAKGGLKMLTKSMAVEWGPYGIQTNAIGPGYFITELTKPLVEDPAFDDWVKQHIPLGRWGAPEELVGTAIFLASGASDYINGQTIYVDGGWLAGM